MGILFKSSKGSPKHSDDNYVNEEKVTIQTDPYHFFGKKKYEPGNLTGQFHM